MGFLSRIFGSSNSKKEFKPAPELTSELMDEGLYWQIIQISIDESGGDPECQENVIVGELEKLKPAEMIGFRLRTDKFLYDSYCSKFWCAGYLMNGGCSDDMFEYFRLWVISKGRDVFNTRTNGCWKARRIRWVDGSCGSPPL